MDDMKNMERYRKLLTRFIFQVREKEKNLNCSVCVIIFLYSFWDVLFEWGRCIEFPHMPKDGANAKLSLNYSHYKKGKKYCFFF